MGIVIVGLIGGIVLLHFWLLGHRFARVLAFLVAVIPFSFLGSAYGHDNTTGRFGFFAGIAVAWVITGLPIYIRLLQAKETATDCAASPDLDVIFASPEPSALPRLSAPTAQRARF